MSVFSGQRIGVAMCTPIPFTEVAGRPVLEMVTTEWCRSRRAIGSPTNYNQIEVYVDGMEVGAARNEAVKRVLAHDPTPQYIFFLDYDVLAPADALCRLIYRAEHYPEYDMFAGVYCSKTTPAEPLIYRGDGYGPHWDWTLGDLLFDITGIHMGLTLIRTSLFKRIPYGDLGWFSTTNKVFTQGNAVHRRQGTEDLFFCRRAREEAGAKILVDTSVLAGHIHHGTRTIFGLPEDSKPVLRTEWLQQGKTKEQMERKKALDLGAGSVRRHWDDHDTYTTDLRPDVGANHVCDSLALPLPDGTYDLVASSHHLEHIGRFDQEKVWEEIYRVCKPGGTIEHVVPNAIWAGLKLVELEAGRDPDEYSDAMNVLYGAQESHGYERDLNTHYFAYTPKIARALAENAGFTDVEIEEFGTRPELGYNMVIRGKKPLPDVSKQATVDVVEMSDVTTPIEEPAELAGIL